MDDLRTAASARYENDSPEVKELVSEAKELDIAADGLGTAASACYENASPQVKELDIAMKDLRTAALACYKNAPPNVKQLVQEAFKSTDTSDDGGISIDEFLEFVEHHDKSMRSLFASLDENRDGHLDFNEFITCYYIAKNRPACGGCKKKLLELYFTCTTCFDNAGDSYDLCVTCYSEKSFKHYHNSFLDNHLMLASKKRRATKNEGVRSADGIGLTSKEVRPAAGIGVISDADIEISPDVIRRKREGVRPADGVCLTSKEVIPAAGIGVISTADIEISQDVIGRKRRRKLVRLLLDKAIENVSGCGVM